MWPSEQMRIEYREGYDNKGRTFVYDAWAVLPGTEEHQRELYFSMQGDMAYVYVRVGGKFSASSIDTRSSIHVLVDTAHDGKKYLHLCVGSARFAVDAAEADFLNQEASIPLRDLQSECNAMRVI